MQSELAVYADLSPYWNLVLSHRMCVGNAESPALNSSVVHGKTTLGPAGKPLTEVIFMYEVNPICIL